MKKIALVGATLALAMVAGSAMAANSLNAGTMGLNVKVTDNFVISGKYFVEKDMAILAGAGLRIQGGDNNKGTDIGLMAGIRKYLKSEDLAPFVGGRFEYSSTNDSTLVGMGFTAEAGAEFFLAKQFSLEGRVGFGYSSTENKPVAGATTKTNYIGTTAVGLSANFYF